MQWTWTSMLLNSFMCAVSTPGKGVLKNNSINKTFSSNLEHYKQTHATSAASLGFLPVSIARLPSLSTEVELSKPAVGRSHFFNVPGTMGCFFLEYCCILGAPLPFGLLSYTTDRDRKLWQKLPTFSANQRSVNLCESLSKSLSLSNSVFSSFFEEKKNSELHGTPNVFRTMKWRLFMLLWLSNLTGNLLGLHYLQRQLRLNSRVNLVSTDCKLHTLFFFPR